jgi:rhamnosyltransferase subunit B
MARIIFCTFGSLGDLHPMLALGRELVRRGHSCVVATTPGYREKVERACLEFHPLGPDISIGDPAILRRAMHPRDGTRYILCELVFPYLRGCYQQTAAIARNADLIVTHPVTLGAYLHARRTGMRWASVALAPVSMLSVHDMGVFPGFPVREWLARRGPGTQRLLLKAIEAMLEPYWKPYRALEHELGLPRGRNPILFGHSPQLALALFSPMLASPQPDWPPQARATGFPFLDQGETISPELQRFLDSGDPPIVFTLGSAAIGAAGDFFKQSVEAARRLRRRAVLLVGNDSENPEDGLGAGVISVPYAPHAAVFPRACVNVHQGGIGTTGEAMRAGRPMLVIPYSHDQPDHAYRLKKLGVARSVRREKYTAERAAHEIAELLGHTSYADRAADVGARVRAEQGVSTACDLLEDLTRKEGCVEGSPRC